MGYSTSNLLQNIGIIMVIQHPICYKISKQLKGAFGDIEKLLLGSNLTD